MSQTKVDPHSLRAPNRPLPEALTPLREALEGIDFRKLDARGRDEMDRMLAAGLQAVRLARDRQAGVTRRRGWDQGSPAGIARDPYGRGGVNPFDLLVDHPRREWRNGAKVYVAEPYGYGFGADALRRLAQVVDDGWSIRIDAELATHFPGRTVAVRLRRAEP